MKRWTVGAVGVAALLVVAGCDSGKKIVKVSGTVTRNGKPVPNLTVRFIPENGRWSHGVTDQNGKYTLSYDLQREGAEVGKHKVWVQFRAASPDEETRGTKLTPDRKALIDKYGNENKPAIEVEVKNDGKPIDLQLD